MLSWSAVAASRTLSQPYGRLNSDAAGAKGGQRRAGGRTPTANPTLATQQPESRRQKGRRRATSECDTLAKSHERSQNRKRDDRGDLRHTRHRSELAGRGTGGSRKRPGFPHRQLRARTKHGKEKKADARTATHDGGKIVGVAFVRGSDLMRTPTLSRSLGCCSRFSWEKCPQ